MRATNARRSSAMAARLAERKGMGFRLRFMGERFTSELSCIEGGPGVVLVVRGGGDSGVAGRGPRPCPAPGNPLGPVPLVPALPRSDLHDVGVLVGDGCEADTELGPAHPQGRAD